MSTPPIDRDRRRVGVRKPSNDDARPEDLQLASISPADLREAVERFHIDSLEGAYYQDFVVNSKNFMERSRGTERWIAECRRLLDLCVEAARTEAHRDTRAAFELLFDLLLQVDECDDDIVFFVDEAGSWQVGVRWPEVMPAWFRCLAATAPAEEFARQVHAMISYFAHDEAKRLLPEARRLANEEQKAALARRPAPKQSYKRPIFGVVL